MTQPVKIFYCYAREDEPYLNSLKKHLMPLKRSGLIEDWYDRLINAGSEWEKDIEQASRVGGPGAVAGQLRFHSFQVLL